MNEKCRFLRCLVETLLQNDQSLRFFFLFACEDSKKLLSCLCGAIFQFYEEKWPQDAKDAEVSELCGSASPHPVRSPAYTLEKKAKNPRKVKLGQFSAGTFLQIQSNIYYVQSLQNFLQLLSGQNDFKPTVWFFLCKRWWNLLNLPTPLFYFLETKSENWICRIILLITVNYRKILQWIDFILNIHF